MLADMKQLVLEAEEEEHIYVVNQEQYIIEQQAKADGHITEEEMEDMAAYYEAKGIER